MPNPDSAALERGYRRLLGRYPASYRAAREEEMLTTLMEAAAPGQRRPHPRDRVDLTLGAARAQLRHNLEPGLERGLAAAALPAALLLVALLGGHLIYAAGWTIALRWEWFAAATYPPNDATSIALRYLQLPIVSSLLLGGALLGRKPALARIVAAGVAVMIACIFGLGLGSRMGPYTAMTVEDALVPALLALLVAAAPSAALLVPRGYAVRLALALVALPLLGDALGEARYLQVYLRGKGIPADPELFTSVSAPMTLAALAIAAGLLLRGRQPGARAAIALVAAATAPLLVAAALQTVGADPFAAAWYPVGAVSLAITSVLVAGGLVVTWRSRGRRPVAR